MRTKVRIHQPQRVGDKYETINIGLLTKEYPTSSYLSPYGYLSLQRNIGENRWYALRYNCESNRAREVQLLAKVAAHLEKVITSDLTIEELLLALNAEQYFYTSGLNLPITDVGKEFYKVYNEKGDYYQPLIAIDGADMKRKFGKILKTNPNFKIQFSHVIEKDYYEIGKLEMV